ncbi:MAG TPA: regulatory protein RecX [Patescibacteria group bacterium]|nr:regulatory protein RecX [Patescibacteria group bacterium]
MLRGFVKSDIDEVLVRLSAQGLLNDYEFAQNYLDSLMRNKTFGFYGLKAKLMSHGVASNEAEKLLSENLSLEHEREIAQKFLDKNPRETDRERLAQKLSRKGFRSQVISQVLAEKP